MLSPHAPNLAAPLEHHHARTCLRKAVRNKQPRKPCTDHQHVGGRRRRPPRHHRCIEFTLGGARGGDAPLVVLRNGLRWRLLSPAYAVKRDRRGIKRLRRRGGGPRERTPTEAERRRTAAHGQRGAA